MLMANQLVVKNKNIGKVAPVYSVYLSNDKSCYRYKVYTDVTTGKTSDWLCSNCEIVAINCDSTLSGQRTITRDIYVESSNNIKGKIIGGFENIVSKLDLVIMRDNGTLAVIHQAGMKIINVK